jgi:hypothetical protein
VHGFTDSVYLRREFGPRPGFTYATRRPVVEEGFHKDERST